jgi:colanic acid/amylovoran biosynthesis glycosyltransferase
MASMRPIGFFKRNRKYIAIFLFPAALIALVSAGIMKKIGIPPFRRKANGHDTGKWKKKKIAYLTGMFPRFAMTFLRNEVVYLRNEGVNTEIISRKLPIEKDVQKADKKLMPYVTYLEPFSWLRAFLVGFYFLHTSPRGFFRFVQFYVSHREKWSWDFFSSFKVSLFLAWIIKRHRIDHVHSYFAYELIYCLSAHMLTGVEFSTGAHASDIYRGSKMMCFKEAAADIHFIRATSAYNKIELLRIIDKSYYKKVKIVYVSIDPDRFKIRTKVPLSGKPVLLSVCRLDPKKGLGFLIMAMNILRQRGRKFRGIIVGDGEDRGYLNRLIAEYSLQDSVTMTGAVDHLEVAEYYKKARLFVLPCIVLDNRTSDGIPVVLMEAQSMGIPVVSTRVSGIPELVLDGYSGRLVPQKDCFTLANIIEELLDNTVKLREMGLQGRKTVLDKFSNEKNMKQLLDLFLS